MTQAAPLDALRQRFGRLNRGGRAIRATGAILAAAEDVAAKANDPIYADRTQRTWQVLEALATESVIDFGAYHKQSPKHLHRYVRCLAGKQGIRRRPVLDQVALVTRSLVGRRLTYRDLVADNGLPSGARS